MPSPFFGITRKLKIIILPLIAAILTALYIVMDKYYLSEVSSNPYAYSFLSLWLGLITLVVFMLVMRIPLKKKQLIGIHIDPNYHGFILPKGKFLLWLFVAGLGAAVSSLTYFYLVDVTTPSTMIPFSRIVIIYFVISEVFHEKTAPTIIEIQSIVMIMVGVFLMAMTDLNFDLLTILIVLGPYNLSNMLFTIGLQKAKRMIYKNRRNDSLNIRMWSIAFSAILLTVLLIPFMNQDFLNALALINPFIVIFIMVDMMIATLAMIAYIRALGVAKMSIVNSIMAFTVVLGIPLSLIGNLFFPGAFGLFSSDPIFWLFKGLGALIIIIGIITIGISQVKAYLMIYIEGSSENVLKKLTNIKGIVNISAVSGALLLIATLKIRSLGRAYRTIVNDLEKIEGIKRVVTLTSLKEWEKL
ncbi:MAG TPA: EamA family transporter [Candidatus Deferrimicrobium sp.]|nr:EamA family transporter [Candidatus Deferrimicrobium sp.]